MQKQSTLNSKRNEIQQNYRREHLKKVFGQHRRTLKQELTKFEQQEFNRIYPQIDEDNFQSHLSFILKYSCNDDYNFRLVAFSGYLYQFIVNNPSNQEALQILQSLSYYEELQLPQTEELASILVQNLQKHSTTILQIVYNLLQASKYYACLRNYLIQLDFTQKLQDFFKSKQKQKQQQVYEYSQQLYLGILCSFISTHPLVQYKIFQQLLKTTFYFSNNNSDRIAMVLIALSDVFSSINEDKLKAELVLNYYGTAMVKQYFNCEYQVINIIYYGVKSNIMIQKSFWKLLSSSLQSNNFQAVQKIVMICDMLTKLQHLKQDIIQMFVSNNFMNRFIKTYDHCQQKSKLRILSVLSSLINQILVKQQQLNGDNQLNLHQLSNILKSGLQSLSQEIKQRTVDLIFFILQIINENQMIQFPLRQHLQQQGVVEILTNLQMEQQILSEKIQYILKLLQTGEENEKGHI